MLARTSTTIQEQERCNGTFGAQKTARTKRNLEHDVDTAVFIDYKPNLVRYWCIRDQGEPSELRKGLTHVFGDGATRCYYSRGLPHVCIC